MSLRAPSRSSRSDFAPAATMTSSVRVSLSRSSSSEFFSSSMAFSGLPRPRSASAMRARLSFDPEIRRWVRSSRTASSYLSTGAAARPPGLRVLLAVAGGGAARLAADRAASGPGHRCLRVLVRPVGVEVEPAAGGGEVLGVHGRVFLVQGPQLAEDLLVEFAARDAFGDLGFLDAGAAGALLACVFAGVGLARGAAIVVTAAAASTTVVITTLALVTAPTVVVPALTLVPTSTVVIATFALVAASAIVVPALALVAASAVLIATTILPGTTAAVVITTLTLVATAAVVITTLTLLAAPAIVIPTLTLVPASAV